jgi:hypothetical protein
MIHYAKADNSERLKMILGLLQTGPKTSLQIQQRTNSVCVGTEMSELRAQGIPVSDAEYIGRSFKTGRKIYRYKLNVINHLTHQK